ncbi:MAG: NfeD family protein [Thermomicrobiales bacterium]|nr:NfeD family protein [Thermomicrobiales bacterium]MCO5219323.1 NfeD family protein [Thermomicrobiales bacterium]MCO5225883.1 NfeD family protein [Thermomicrobiales bacterium]MCO5227583.1 NfeD family protein [Thermomicrobiales bacterium]
MFPINDLFDAFLIGGFLFGLFFTIASVALGFGDIGADTGSDVGSDIGHDLDHGGHGPDLFNVSSILAFITWFTGVTYLVRNGLGWFVGLAVLIGLLFGVAGAWFIAWFLYSFLRKNSPELNPADWDQIGQIGHVSGTIFPNGYGEIVYEQHGSRHSLPARSKEGVGIDRNTEVVVLAIEKGVAVVQPWADLMQEISLEEEQ